MQLVNDGFPSFSDFAYPLKMPFAMTSHNGCLVAQAKMPAAFCNDVSRPNGYVRICSFSSLTFPALQAATVTAIMVSLHIGYPICGISSPSALCSILFYVFLFLVICRPVAETRCSVTSPDLPLLCLSPFPSPQQVEASEATSTIGTGATGTRQLLTVYYHSKLAISLFTFSSPPQHTTGVTLSIGAVAACTNVSVTHSVISPNGSQNSKGV